jgi:crotonobetainyl-CoA:carnitine CoA-transferase CaiB-like acyl-CoA transferase
MLGRCARLRASAIRRVPDSASPDAGASALLTGLRVVEISQLIAAPMCGLALSDLGADVVKVEPPEGDPTRSFAPMWDSGRSGFFEMLNRGKRGVAVDLRDERAREFVHRLIAGADVVVENLAEAGSWMSRESHAARDPRLIWCAITGLGAEAGGRAMDPTLQASMGVMALIGESDGPPLRVPMPVIDLMTGSQAVQRVLAAIIARERTGRGAFLDCALLDAAAVVASAPGVIGLAGGAPRRLGSASEFCAPSAVFATRDRRYVSVVALTDRHWQALCVALERQGWREDPRYRSNDTRLVHRADLHAEIQAILITAPAMEWVARISAAGGFCELVREVEEAWSDSRLCERGLIGELEGGGRVPMLSVRPPMRHAGSSPLPAAPELGAHSRTIAIEAGFDANEIDELVAAGVLCPPHSQPT